jgi:hypothetical protein
MKRKRRPKGGPPRGGEKSGPPKLPAHVEVEDERSPDVHLLVAIAAFVSDDLASSVRSARRAFLENLYLPAALRGESPPDLGLVHGVEDAQPGHARALVAELKPILKASPDVVPFLLEVAAAPTSVRERDELVSHARRLLREPDAAVREKLQRAVDRIRDPARIAATSIAALAEVQGPQAGGCGGGGPSFDV